MGAWHESLNLAAVWRLPVVFLVMNNAYGMGTSVERASAVTDLHRRAAAYDIPSLRVDGDDLLAVVEASSSLLSGARSERVPARARVGYLSLPWPFVADPGFAYRSAEEIEEHMHRDPIQRVRALLVEEGLADAELEGVEHAAQERVAAAVEWARAARRPQ